MGGQTAYPNDLLGESSETCWWLTGDDLLTSQVTDDETRARQVVSSAAPAPAESPLRVGEITELPLAAAPDSPWCVGVSAGDFAGIGFRTHDDD